MIKRVSPAFVIAGIALLLFAGLMFVMPSPDAVAAPPAVITPVGVTYAPGISRIATFADGQVITSSGALGTVQNVQEFEAMDVQVVVDEGDSQALTLTLQFSNDGDNWVDGPALGSNLTADTNTLDQHAIFGRYGRVNAEVGTDAAITITVIGVGK